MKVLVIVGPTGIGKSELSLDIAKKYNGEIISGDSIQIYKELNIGSAKVTPENQQGIKHHLIDEYELDEPYSVAIFQSEARRLITEITDRDKLPIIVGGTGLYISAVLKNYIFQEEKEDEKLLDFLKSLHNETLHNMLVELDSESAQKLHKNNRQRVIRAIMIAKGSKKLKSDISEDLDDKLLYDAHIISLTMPRPLLYERINERVLLMDKEGLEVEVSNIVYKYEKPFELRGMFGIGYKEWKPYFEGSASKESVIKEIQKKSRNLAKRQYTWFRNQFEAAWFDILESNYKKEIYQSINSWLYYKEDKNV